MLKIDFIPCSSRDPSLIPMVLVPYTGISVARRRPYISMRALCIKGSSSVPI